jgi:kynurenine formamidase
MPDHDSDRPDTATERAFGNWGRWGEGDQRGALNLLTPDAVLRGMRAVRRGEVASLALPIQPRGVPAVPFRPPMLHFMTLDAGDYEAGAARGAGGFQFADDYIAMPAHAGTHVDALSHVARAGRMYNGYPASDVRSTRGARSLGIEHFGGLMGRALLLDICAVRDRPCLEAGTEIGIEDLVAALERAELEVEPGDSILLRTGWLERFREDDPGWYDAEPGLGIAAASWLAGRDVTLIAADNYGVEVIPSPSGETMPVHLVCLQEYGIHLMELVDLRPLVQAGVSECLLTVAPLPIRGGVGSPVNPIAAF